MGIVTFNISMSLDGFVAGPNDEVDQVFAWYFAGDTEYLLPGGNMAFKVSAASAKLMQESVKTTGAMVTGKRNFVNAQAWGGHPPLGVHHFVVTHQLPQEWVKPGSPFTFVTDGVSSAIAQAKKYAGDKNVVISSPTVMREALKAGLLDELTIDLVSVLIGKGIRLFEALGIEPVQLERLSVVAGTGVTHLRFRVIK